MKKKICLLVMLAVVIVFSSCGTMGEFAKGFLQGMTEYISGNSSSNSYVANSSSGSSAKTTANLSFTDGSSVKMYLFDNYNAANAYYQRIQNSLSASYRRFDEYSRQQQMGFLTTMANSQTSYAVGVSNQGRYVYVYWISTGDYKTCSYNREEFHRGMWVYQSGTGTIINQRGRTTSVNSRQSEMVWQEY